MGLERIISALIAFDKAGQEIVQKAKEEQQEELLHIDADKQEMYRQYRERLERDLERFQQAEAGTFDAILMDVQMPVMNGHEASRAIRALERPDTETIPIIAMTANAFSEDEKAALDAGMDAHVAKPLDMDLLKKAIRQHRRRKEEQ